MPPIKGPKVVQVKGKGLPPIKTPKDGGAKGLFELLHEENKSLDIEIAAKKRKAKGKPPKKSHKKHTEPPKPMVNHELAPRDLIGICAYAGVLLFLAVSIL